MITHMIKNTCVHCDYLYDTFSEVGQKQKCCGYIKGTKSYTNITLSI